MHAGKGAAGAAGEIYSIARLDGTKAIEDARKDADDAKRRAATSAEPPSVEETSTAKEPISTFSLHVSDVSFRLAQAALARGEAPDPTQMRPEEIYNAFDYGDPSPTAGEKVGARIEQAAHPFLQQRNLVRIALKVAATGRTATRPLRLTVLLDTSGSMEREDRVATVRRAMEVLVSLLGANDRITLIGFARQPRLLAEDLPGAQARSLLDIIARTPAEGGTNLEEALKLASELARRHQAAGSQNRIVLLTDGAANLGDADPARLAAMVETLRQQGIAFDACGVGLNGLDDAMLEPLARKGDGRYYVLDSPEAADAGFARQLAGAFRPAAENVKVQVRFNPARVANYRLIGFEQHRLKTEDFRNDKVDAAELAAEEAAVALYQVEPLPQGEGELGEVYVRFRNPTDGTMVERSWTMPYEAHAAAFDRASSSMQLAGAAALVAEKLRASPLAGQFKLGDLAGIVNGLRTRYPDQARVQEFATMFGQMRRIANE
jgi:Mg-chelatase subunit ChlD